MSLENIVFSGFKHHSYNQGLFNKYNVSDIIDNNTKYVIIKDINDIESYTKSSAKIKLAIKNRIPIITEKKLNEINIKE